MSQLLAHYYFYRFDHSNNLYELKNSLCRITENCSIALLLTQQLNSELLFFDQFLVFQKVILIDLAVLHFYFALLFRVIDKFTLIINEYFAVE